MIEDLIGVHRGTATVEYHGIGKVGTALKFDGNRDKTITVDNSADFNFGSRPFTIEGWIKTESGQPQFIFSKFGVIELSINNPTEGCGGDNNLCLFIWSEDDSIAHVGVGSVITIGGFIFITIVREETTITVYVNGEPRGTLEIPETIASNDAGAFIGGRFGAVSAFNGLIDELTIYQRALTAEEIHAIYTADSAGKCKDESYQSPAMCSDGIDNDGDGSTDCADSGCSDTGNTYSLSSSATRAVYEVPLLCPGSRVSTAVRGATLNNLNLCDRDTEDFGNRVTLCNIDNTRIYQTLDATSILRGRNQDPFTDQGVTFLFDEVSGPGEQKKVTLHSTEDLTAGMPLEFDLQNFTTNILKGQRPIIIVDGEYYLLSYNGVGFFSEQNLKMTHVPEGFEYVASLHPGTNVYKFDLLGDRIMQMFVDDVRGKFTMQALPPGQAPVSFAVPENLAQKLEVTFTQSSPVRITDPALGVLTVCRDDNAGDSEQMKVCQNNDFVFTLRAGELTKRTMEGADYAFLFTVVDGVKKASIFMLERIHATPESPRQLNYDNFINAMTAGRRIAFEFPDDGTLYLAGHPRTALLNLPSVSINAYTGGTPSPFTAHGSQGQVEFIVINNGKIFIKRNYGNPPPPFDVWARTQAELAPIDLEQQLFTSISSLGPTRFIQPDFATINVRAEDIAFSSSVFKINSESRGNIDLAFNVPQIIDNALFYYNSATIDARIPQKSASIYRFYSLSAVPAARQHDYDDNFINVFTAGNKLALGFGASPGQRESYYLLGHENEANEPAFFNLERLRLSPLAGGDELTPEAVTENSASFTVPEGRIIIRTDDFGNKIHFEKETGRDLLERIDLQDEDYSILLTTSNRVVISGTILELCNLGIYGSRTAADVCYPSGGAPVNDIVVDGSAVLKVGSNTYLLETNGRTGDAKQVTVRRILQFVRASRDRVLRAQLALVDWNIFTQHLQDGDVPIVNITHPLLKDAAHPLPDAFYLPSARNNLLESFSLQPYPRGTNVLVRNVQALSPILSNGSLIFGDRVIFVEQSVSGAADARVVSATFTHQPFSYVPDDSSPLVLNSSAEHVLDFVAVPGGSIFRMGVDNRVDEEQDLVRVNLQGIFNRLFAAGDVRILHLSGVTIQLEVTTIGTRDDERYAVITLTRIP
ncbi:LamG domain-containing protein [Candidatus Woesearchaeota archaeon]|nr:LamG domain-containing protein [Candidatus Woesearchaeota archaeon]